MQEALAAMMLLYLLIGMLFGLSGYASGSVRSLADFCVGLLCWPLLIAMK